jgi:hypothetical protein
MLQSSTIELQNAGWSLCSPDLRVFLPLAQICRVRYSLRNSEPPYLRRSM